MKIYFLKTLDFIFYVSYTPTRNLFFSLKILKSRRASFRAPLFQFLLFYVSSFSTINNPLVVFLMLRSKQESNRHHYNIPKNTQIYIYIFLTAQVRVDGFNLFSLVVTDCNAGLPNLLLCKISSFHS